MNSFDDSCGPPTAKQPAASSSQCTDVAEFVGTRISSADRYQLLVSHFKPGANYSFPKSSSGRKFQYRWIVQYPWLVISRHVNGGFCLPCALFAQSGYHGSDPGILVSHPLTMFTKALELFHKHANKGYHKEAVVRADKFVKVMSHKQPDIRSRLSQAKADMIALNCKKLASIFETIVLCGTQNIPLRGHRDNITDIERDLSQSENHGNFHTLLKFRVEAGDKMLGEHLATGS